jgi:anaerobic selenocysteine-containing dehydrogenase
MSGIPLSYSPGTVDQWPKNLSSHLMFGGWWSFPVPDIERTDLLIVMGANPAASQGSLLAAPNVMGIIDSIRKRGKVIVIDPVRTATAARADEWLPITPGTDAALLLAVVHTLFAENLVKLGGVEPHIDGVDRMRQVAAEWSPERVAAVTGILQPHPLLGRELAGTDRRCVRPNWLCNQEFGSLASWLVDVVNILTGHFDTSGGSMFPRAAAWSGTVQPIPGLEDGAPEFGRYRTRVRGAKEVLGQVPVSCLAEEIATPGEGQLRALITVAGNPVLSTPAGHRLDEVLPTLDAMISVDLWLNETTRRRRDPPARRRSSPPRRSDPQLRHQQHRELLASGVRARGPGPAGGVGDPDPADRAVHGHARRGCRRRGDRRRVLRLHGVHAGARRRDHPPALRPRRA